MGRFLTAVGLAVASLALLGCGHVDKGAPNGETSGSSAQAVPLPTTSASGACAPNPEALTDRTKKVENGELTTKRATFETLVEVRGCEINKRAGLKKQICNSKPPSHELPDPILKEQTEMIKALQKEAGC